MTVVGTICANRKGLPPTFRNPAGRPVGDYQVRWDKNRIVSRFQFSCCVFVIVFWPMNPGWGKSRHPDPGWTILSIFSFTYDFWCCSDGKKSDRDKKIQDQQPFYLLFVLPFLFLLKTWHYNYNSNICIHSEITKKKSGKINNVIVISSMTTIQGLTKDTRKPAVTCLYNVTMGGTDVVDLIMSHNSVRWKCNHWTMSTLAYLLDTAAVN